MDIEKDFKPFAKALSSLGYLLHDSEMGTFNHFLEYIIAQHSHTVVKDLKNASKAVKLAYFDTYKEYIKLYYLKIHTQHKEWFDAFGLYFEINSSKFSRDKRGQFFTPENLCDCMCQMMVTKDMVKERVFDPACGSGRLLLASHVYNPKNYHFGQDLDYTCCLMSAVNMMMHGIQGEVVHGNSLDPDSYFQGWAINPNIIKLRGIPHIENLAKENSFIYHVAQGKKSELLEEKKKAEEASIEKIKNTDFLNVGKENRISIDKSKDEKTSFDFF
jgi:type I restriction enzyme M protein